MPVLTAPGMGGVLYATGAGLLGLAQFVVAALFWHDRSDANARLLLRTTLIYLPTVLVMLMLAPWI